MKKDNESIFNAVKKEMNKINENVILSEEKSTVKK